MNPRIKASSKGQVVLPKLIRDRLGISSGTLLDVIDTPRGVELRPVRAVDGMTVDEAITLFRRIYRHEGPPVPLDQLSWSPDMDER